MDSFKIDFVDITLGLFVLSVGLIAVLISLFRLKSRDFSLLNFGLISSLYGLRWLVETPTMKTLVGFPFTFPYFHGILTYILVIPFSGLLLNIFGRGLYNSLRWLFYSTILYAVVAVPIDLLRLKPLGDVSVNQTVVVLWGLVGIANVLYVRRKRDIDITVLKAVFLITLVSLTIDNLVYFRTVSSGINIQHPSFMILFFGLGFVAVHHTFINDRKLQAIEQEIEIARRIQQSNLPMGIRPPKGIDIATKYVPMSAVAGDFYDVQIKNETGMGVLIADVSGHGVGSALIGSMLKIAFASQAEHVSDPARVLTEINRMLRGKLEDSFITAFSLFIDLSKRKLCYASAGHPAPLLWKKSTVEMHRLSHGGLILGPIENPVYKNYVMDIESSDRLVLYTDGITEFRDRTGEFFGEDRLEAFVKKSATDSAERTADQFIDHLSQWSGRSNKKSFDDDLALIIVDIL